MADEVIGTARIDITASAEGVESAVARSKRSLQDFSKEAQAAYQQADSAAKRATTGLVKWVQQQEALNAPIERTTASLKLFNAAMSGVPLRVLEEARQRIDQLASSQDAAAVAAQRMSDAAAFEKQHLAAQRLVKSSEYVRWWEDALVSAELAEKQLQETRLFEQQNLAAQRLVKSSEYVRWWEDALVSAELAEKQLQETRLFEQQNLAAQRLVKSSEYVRWWEDALEKADAAERQISSDKAFLKSLSDRANAAGKTAAEMLELQAAERGLSDQAAPFIARLKEQEGALRRSGAEFNKYGLTAKMEMAALRQVPAQITDIIVSLQGGQRPLTVLLQQGGQLKDVFGGVVPAAKAMAGALVGMINPATMALGAVAGLAAAYYAGATELDAFEKNAIMTGNALGLTADRASVMTKEMAALADISRREAAAALTAVAASGKVASGQIESVAIVAARAAQVLGRDVSEVVSEFAKLAEKPAEASAELNRRYNYLTTSVYEQIRALESQGRTQDAARLAQEAYAKSTIERLNDVEKSLGWIERAWTATGRAAKSAWDFMADVGRPTTTQDILAAAERSVLRYEQTLISLGLSADATEESLKNVFLSGTNRSTAVDAIRQLAQARAAQAAAEASAAGEDFTADAKAWSAEEVRKRIDAVNEFGKLTEGYLSRQAQMEKEIAHAKEVGLAAGKSEADIERLILSIREKYEEKRAGGISATQTELANLKARLVAEQARTEQLTSMGTALSKLNEGEKLALSYAEKSKLATDAKTKAALAEYEAFAKRLGIQIRSNDEYEAELKTAESSLKKVQDESRAMKDQISVYGMSKGAIEEMAIARLREREALLAGTPGQEKLLELIRQEIAEREKLGGLLNQYEILEKQRKEWEQWQRDIGQIFDQVGQSLTDAIFEGGKSGRDLVKDLFKTLTLKILIQPVMGMLQEQVTQSLGGVFGLQDPKQSGAGGLLGTASNLSTLYSAVTGGLTSTVASSIASAGSFFGSTAATSFAAGMQGSTLAAGLAGPTTAGASGAMGAGATFGAALPWVGGALAVGSLLAGTGVLDGLFGGGAPKTTHSQSTAFRADASGTSQFDDDDRVGSDIVGAVRDLTTATRADLNSMLTMLGTSYQLADIEARIRTTVQGKNSTGSWGTLVDASGRERHVGEGFRQGFDDLNAGDNLVQNLQVDLQRLTLSAFRAAADEMPEFVRQAVAVADPYAQTDEEVNALYSSLVGLINGAEQLRSAMETLPFANLHDLSLDAAAGLLQLSGGLENLASAQQTYLQNFYSEAERQQIAVDGLTKSLAGVGVEIPALIGSADAMRAQYRALIEAQNLETEAGRQAYIVLMNNAGAFSQVADSAQAAAQASQQAAQAAAQQRTDYYKSALDAVNRFGQQQIAALQQTFGETDQAMQAYRTAFQDVQRQWQGLLSALDQGIKSLRGSADSAFERQYTEARARISTALVTGQISDKSAMTDAIKIAQQGVTGGIYASQFDQEKAYLVLANQLEGLQNIAQPELDAATATLEQLEAQYALLRGTKRTLDDSLDALKTQVQQAMTAEEAARVQIDQIQAQIDWAQKQYDELTGTRSDMVGGFQSLADALAAFSKPVPGTTGTGGAITGVVPGPGEPADVSAGSITSRALDYLSNNPDVATAWNQDSGGLSFQQFAVMHYEKYGQYEGRKFARGGYYPGGLALVGEEGPELINFRSPGQVYTADQTHDILRRGVHPQAGADRELIAEVRRLREDNRAMRQELSAIRKSTTQLAEQFDQVSAGGNALATETF